MNTWAEGAREAIAAWMAVPNHAVSALVAGILFIYAEFNRPGEIIWGAMGMLLAVLGLRGLFTHPLAPAALWMAVAGFGLLGVEGWLRTRALSGVAGTALLAWSMAHLGRTQADGPDTWLGMLLALLLAAVTVALLRTAKRARWSKFRLGAEALIGKEGTVTSGPASSEMGLKVLVAGELWPLAEEVRVERDMRVVVVGQENGRLQVEPMHRLNA